MFPIIEPRRTPHAQQFGIPSDALIAACQRALVARNEADTVRPKILAIQTQVLAEEDYQMAGNWQEFGLLVGRITDPASAYEMSEERFLDYYNACAAKYRAAGYVFPDQQCPLAIAEDVQVQAEKAFGLACKELRLPVMPQEAMDHGFWREFLGAMFTIVVPYLPQQ